MKNGKPHATKVYDDAFADATAKGERRIGAHHIACEATYTAGVAATRLRPWRTLAHRWLLRLAERFTP